MIKQISILTLFFCSVSIFSSDYLECIFEVKIKSLSGPVSIPKKNNKVMTQKANFSIQKLIKASEDGVCDRIIKKKSFSKEIHLDKGDTLKKGKTVKLKYEHIVSEVIENDKVSDLKSFETWYFYK